MVWQQAVALLMGLKVRNGIGEKDLAGAVETALHHRTGGGSAPGVNYQPTRCAGHKARLRARSHCRFVLEPPIRLTPESLRNIFVTYSVPLFLKRQCDRTLGTEDQSRGGPGPGHSQS
jgi:hypothetical protein